MEGYGANCSNHSSDSCHAVVYQQVAGSIIFVIIWPLIVMDFKCFPIGRPAAALLGAVLMVLFHVINQEKVYRTEGEQSNLQTIILLISMMILSYYFDREGILTMLSVKMFGKSLSLRKILWRVCILSAAVSAFITNDAACLLIAPLVLNMYARQTSRANVKELLPLSLGIATSANIGSAATIFGNPQNVLVAANTNVTLVDFFIAETPTAILALMINIGLLYLIFCRVIFKSAEGSTDPERTHLVIDSESTTPAPSIHESRNDRSLNFDASTDPYQTSQIAREREIHYVGGRDPEAGLVVPTYRSNSSHQQRSLVCSIHNYSQPTQAESTLTASVNNVAPLKERSISNKVFIVWLFLISAVVIITLAINAPKLKKAGVYFNLGLIPAAAAVFTMLVDSIVNKKYQQDSIMKIDWTVILMFMGIFVWIEGFKATCIPDIVFNAMKKFMNLKKPLGVLVFTIFIVIGSNVFSNVPLVILMVDHLDDLYGDKQHGDTNFKTGPLLLAWISTIAGNLTLIGSIANLIVAEKAKNSDAKYNLSFLRYLPYGLFSTIVITIVTVPFVYLLALGASKV